MVGHRKKLWRLSKVEGVTIIIIWGILGAIALPSLLSQKGCGCKCPAVKHHIGAMNRAQQAHALEKQQFATSIADLEIDVPTQTNSYNYSLRSTPLYAIQSATPRQREDKKLVFKGYIGMVVFVGRNPETKELQTEALFCEMKKPTITPPLEPIFKNDVLRCPSGTKAYSLKKSPEIEIRDRDLQLAYKSLNLAERGTPYLALQLAGTIKDPKVKEKTAAAITAVEP